MNVDDWDEKLKMQNIRLAIALEDIDRVPTETRLEMFAGRLDFEHPIAHAGEPRQTNVPALEFNCELIDAAIIIDVLRSWDRDAKQSATRAFVRLERPGAAWRKIPGNVVLTRMYNDQTYINWAALEVSDNTTSVSREVAKAVPIFRNGG